jgi:hypothetical protein
MPDRATEKYSAWEHDDTVRALLWGALGVGLVVASAATGVASLFGLALLVGGIVAGIKAMGEVGRAAAAADRIEGQEALNDARRASVEISAAEIAAALK